MAKSPRVSWLPGRLAPPIHRFDSLSPDRFSPISTMSVCLPRFLLTLLVLGLLIVLGTLEYTWIEGQLLADALYMTVITVTAIEYTKVFELTLTE